MQTHKSWMKKETKRKYDKTKPCKAKSHEWEKKQRCHIYSLFLFSFMTYGFPWFSFVIFTLRFFSHSWLMGLHGLVLSYLLFVSFLIHDLSKNDKTKPCKPISHQWEKEQRVNMTKLNHAKP
jgi:hypothetical protein